MGEDTKDNSGVVIPPPFIYVAGFLLGYYVIQPRLPFALIPGATMVARLLGWLVALGAGLLAGSAFFVFRRAGTSPIPTKPTTALVVRGPYRFTRNPMYVSLALLYAGLCLLVNALWPLVLLPVVLVVVRLYVIAREERYLAAKFGDAYRAYQAQVRRWL